MGWLLFVLFVAVPFVDLVLLLRIGGFFGFWPTVAFTLGMGALGAWLAKREGVRVFRAWRKALAELKPPAEGIVDGVLVFVGGALLITPGVITDVMGFSLLIPWTRRHVARVVRAAIDRKIKRGQLQMMTTMSSFDPFGVPFERPPFDDAASPHPPSQHRARGPRGGGVVDTTGESVSEPSEQLPRKPDA